MLDSMLETIRCREDAQGHSTRGHGGHSVLPSRTDGLSAHQLFSSTWAPKPNANQTRSGGGRERGQRPAGEATLVIHTGGNKGLLLSDFQICQKEAETSSST